MMWNSELAIEMTVHIDKVREIRLEPGTHIHLVGIGGTGLSAIARVLLGKGFVVSGSDRQSNEFTDALASAGAVIFVGHDPLQVSGADIVLVSSAVPAENPEVIAARALSIPVMKRAEFLAALLAGAYEIAVSGSHGKTSTTGMIAQIMVQAELDPSIIVGGVLPLLGGNGRAGASDYFLIEADEYDYMFLGLQPQIAVVTNVEYDHPDLYLTIDDYRQAFQRFVSQIRSGGKLIICADDQGADNLGRQAAMAGMTVESYGLGLADWQALELRPNQLGGTDFLVQHGSSLAGLARLRVPGQHNVQNAMAATAVAHALGIGFNTIRQALAEFGGVSRRFQIVGEVNDVIVIDDYAHHPTEIRVTLAAAKQRYPGRRVWAVWQPHTFTRIKKLFDEFATSFSDADRVIVLEIYRSRETDTLGIYPEDILKAMNHADASYQPDVDVAAAYLLDRVRPGDVILTLTAGDGNLVGLKVLEGLRSRMANGYSNGPKA